jgi:hypothetical protein
MPSFSLILAWAPFADTVVGSYEKERRSTPRSHPE